MKLWLVYITEYVTITQLSMSTKLATPTAPPLFTPYHGGDVGFWEYIHSAWRIPPISTTFFPHPVTERQIHQWMNIFTKRVGEAVNVFFILLFGENMFCFPTTTCTAGLR